ncbi:hypothetical protein [Pacificibacter marinus]|uniref:hypothetical protein n=1 Tax=Pacificibacter marinus TaxID=658057 RepID=UPI000B818A88|nr:hypothetical protein [Pacificibacter marinus]
MNRPTDATEGLQTGTGLGNGKARQKKEQFTSQMTESRNETCDREGLNQAKRLTETKTIKEKGKKKKKIIAQIANNTHKQTRSGKLPGAGENARLNKNQPQQKHKMKAPDKEKKCRNWIKTTDESKHNKPRKEKGKYTSN